MQSFIQHQHHSPAQHLQCDVLLIEVPMGLREISECWGVWLANINIAAHWSLALHTSVPCSCLLTILIVSAQVGTFNKEKALVGTISRHCEILQSPVDTSSCDVLLCTDTPLIITISW